MIVKRRNIILVLLLMSVVQLVGQNRGSLEKQGLSAYGKGDYYLAINYLTESINRDTVSDTALLVLAHAYRHIHHCGNALRYYDQLLNQNDVVFPQAWFYAGLMQKCLGYYEEAANAFLQYSLSGDKKISQARLSQELLSCDLAPEIIRDTLDVKVEQPGKKINSPYTDFGAVQLEDGSIYFSSLRPTANSGSSGLIPADFETNIYLSGISLSGYRKAQIWDTDINKKRTHSANINFSPNRQELFFTRCERFDGKMVCKIFHSQKNERAWGNPRPLTEVINQKDVNSTHPFLANVNGQEILYFVTDREGGYGGLDIWYSVRQNGKFTNPVNLGPLINTPGDEITPFYQAQDSVLYFSSDWHAGLGGFDIFKSKGGYASWDKPQNIGYPLNTSANDLYFTINDNGFSGYLTSNRPGSYFTSSQNCCNDIFYYEFSPEQPDTNTTADSTELILSKAKSLLPITLYFDNDVPAPSVQDDTTDAVLDELLQEYAQREQTYLTNYLQYGAPGAQEDEVRMKAFFTDIRHGGILLDSLVDYLKQSLQQGDDIHIVVKGYASPLTTKEYNLKLSKRRIVALMNYLLSADQGSLRPYLKTDSSAALTIYQEAMGEVTSQNISDNPNDKRNSIYSLKAAKARKIVITDVRKQILTADSAIDISKVKLSVSQINLDTLESGANFLTEISIQNDSQQDIFIEDVYADKHIFSHSLPFDTIKAGEKQKMHLQLVVPDNPQKHKNRFEIYLRGAAQPLVIEVSF
ncbi:MAG: hypothetical protein R6T91_04480 [Bacteroidales bacterium]